jgi:hypothetical protein
MFPPAAHIWTPQELLRECMMEDEIARQAKEE